MIEKTIGLIGVGNMGSAILEGVFNKKLALPKQIRLYDKITEKAENFSTQWKAGKVSSNLELIEQSQIILLAVKPQDLTATAAEIKGHLGADQTVISILAGTPLSKLRALLGEKPMLIRAMPNLGAKVGASVTAITGDKEAIKDATEIFSGCGKVLELDEKFFDLVTALSGSGPAYFFLLMELMAKEGEKNGLKEEQARLLSIQTALGAALLAVFSNQSPAQLREMVTSKGGTTEAALKIFESKNFPAIVSEALQAALKRGKELSQ